MDAKLSLAVFACVFAIAFADDGMNGGCMGCEQPVSASDKDFVMALRFAVDDINSKSDTDYRFVESSVTNTTVQVVAGFMYRMDLVMTQSFCTNNQYTMGSGTDYCPLQPSYTSVTCNVAVWDQSWRTPRYVTTEDTCTPMLKMP